MRSGLVWPAAPDRVTLCPLMPAHLMAAPVLDRGGAADRFRNHLRRRAITRVGLIEGDLYLLPFWRCSGAGPEGETTFHLLAVEIGDVRLHRASLPPADLRPYEATAAPVGAHPIEAAAGQEAESQVRARGASLGWRVDALEELIHYPFWLMRIEDSGRVEGGWIDGVEGKIIHHSLKVPPPTPTLARSAWLLATPAALAAAIALGLGARGLVPSLLAVAGAYMLLARYLEMEDRRKWKG